MKLTKKVLANALALSSGIFWVICSLFIWILPGFSVTVTRWWLMGMDISLGQFNLDLATFVLGGISMVIAGWVTGYVIGWSIEYFSKKR